MRLVLLLCSISVFSFAANYERDIIQMIEFKNSQKIQNFEFQAKISILEDKIKNLELEIETLKKSIIELEKRQPKGKK